MVELSFILLGTLTETKRNRLHAPCRSWQSWQSQPGWPPASTHVQGKGDDEVENSLLFSGVMARSGLGLGIRGLGIGMNWNWIALHSSAPRMYVCMYMYACMLVVCACAYLSSGPSPSSHLISLLHKKEENERKRNIKENVMIHEFA